MTTQVDNGFKFISKADLVRMLAAEGFRIDPDSVSDGVVGTVSSFASATEVAQAPVEPTVTLPVEKKLTALQTARAKNKALKRELSVLKAEAERNAASPERVVIAAAPPAVKIDPKKPATPSGLEVVDCVWKLSRNRNWYVASWTLTDANNGLSYFGSAATKKIKK